MSPEQADCPSARDIDTRTDVYTLGVVLYALSDGSPAVWRPSDARSHRLRSGWVCQLREEEPPNPSTKVSGDKEHLKRDRGRQAHRA